MRRALRFLPFLFVLPAASIPVVQTHFGGPLVKPVNEAAAKSNELDALFYQLRHSETAQDASKAEANIYIRLTASSSPTVNFLLEAASAALSNEDDAGAKQILDQVVTLDPDFAEGLTRAASVSYQDGELERAKLLLKKALRIEPRHFGAWAGLGLVLEDQGDLQGAQNAYREALYLHPFLDAAKRGLIKIEAKTDGLSL
jgi:tetratricopeptide (TPR) repeat protein